jgi:hypothetical protein
MKHIHLSMRDLHQIIVTEKQRGKTPDDMVSFLRQRGWPEVTARKFIANALFQDTGSRVPVETVNEGITLGPALWVITLVCIGLLVLAL